MTAARLRAGRAATGDRDAETARRRPDALDIVHVDMDCFYAAVEVLDDPTLVGRPVIVGGTGQRGVVASCSYEARVFGVRSAMPSWEARQRCPQAVFLGGRFDRYLQVSSELGRIFAGVTPRVEKIALDEAFLDVSGARSLLGDPVEIAETVRSRIRDELSLSCSVGVARTKLIAKLASRAAKPVADPSGVRPGTGVVVVCAEEETRFLHAHAVRALWGVGPSTYRKLRALGIETIADLAAVPRGSLVGALGRSAGEQLHRLAQGDDARPVEPERPAKSIGHEETYARDIVDGAALVDEVLRLSDAVARRLRDGGLCARTVSVKVRFADFSTVSRSRTLARPVESGHEIAEAARAIARCIDIGDGVRLVGVSVSHLAESRDAPVQLEFGAGRWEDVTGAVDTVRRRFGEAAIGPAALVTGEGLRVKTRGDTQWGPRKDAPRVPGKG